MICTAWITRRRGHYIQVVTTTQATQDQLEESLEEAIALETQAIGQDSDLTMDLEGFHLEEKYSMVIVIVVDPIVGHTVLSTLDIMFWVLQPPIQKHLD